MSKNIENLMDTEIEAIPALVTLAYELGFRRSDVVSSQSLTFRTPYIHANWADLRCCDVDVGFVLSSVVRSTSSDSHPYSIPDCCFGCLDQVASAVAIAIPADIYVTCRTFYSCLS